MKAIGRVKQFKVGKSVHHALESLVEWSATPHLITYLGPVLEIVYKDAQTDKREYGDTDHHAPVASSRHCKCRADQNDRTRAITQKTTRQKHHHRKQQEPT